MYPTLDDLAVLLGSDPVGRRFLEKIEVGPVPEHAPELGPCIMWKRALCSAGYSTFKGVNLAGKVQQLPGHIWLHQRLHGAVPPGNELDHICHNWELCRPPIPKDCPHRKCVIHVEVKTIRENRLRSGSVPAQNARRREEALTGNGPVWCTGKFGPHNLADEENQYWVAETNHLQCEGCRRGHSDASVQKKRLRQRRRQLTGAG